MKKLILAFGVLMIWTALVKAQEPHKIGFFTDLDLLTSRTKAFSEANADVNDLLQTVGGGLVDSHVLSQGYGLRTGLMLPAGVWGLQWGASLGYIKGPRGEFKATFGRITPSSFVNGNLRKSLESDYFRALLEVRKEWPMSATASLRLRAGAGVAQARMRRRYDEHDVTLDLNTFTTSVGDFREKSTGWRTGPTFELGPSLLFQAAQNVDVEIGVYYMGLPSMKKDEEKGLSAFRWSPIGARLGVGFGVPPREEASSPRTCRLFTALDYWTPSNAYKQVKEAWAEDMGSFQTGSISSHISGGVGARAGVFHSTPVKGLEMGGSLGYILGPRAEFHVNEADLTPTPDSFETRNSYSTRFTRLLLEARQSFAVSESWGLRIGAGLGWTYGRFQEELSCESIGGGCTESFPGRTLSGLTYEAGPAIYHEGQSFGMELGLVYAAFPRVKPDMDALIPGFKWNPIGMRLAVDF